jgi:uncharacterized RDD family membrane protein YckC
MPPKTLQLLFMASAPVPFALLPQSSYASLGRRIAAHLIDTTIAFVVTLAAMFFILYLHAWGFWKVPGGEQYPVDPLSLWREMPGAGRLAVVSAFVVSMGPFYSGLFQASAWQASIAQRLLNVYVTDTAGKRLGLLRSLGRSFTKDLFSAFPFLGAVSIATIAASTRSQALHDYAAKTVVVNGRPPGNGSPGLWRIMVGFGIQFVWYVVTMIAAFRALS